MQRKRNPILITGAVLFLIMAACKKAEKPADLQGAVVTAFQGTVVLVDAKGGRTTLANEILYSKAALLIPGTVLITGKNSSADLAFPGGIQARIGADTKIKMEKSRILTGQNFTDVLMVLEKGKMFNRIGKLSSGSSYQVVTPTSIASVRGTEYMVKQDETGKSETLVQSGSVEVANADMSKQDTVEGGKKGVVGKEGALDVKDLSDADKSELSDMGSNIQNITEQGQKQIQEILNTFDEQKKLIQQTIDEQKKVNEKVIGEQKEKDRQVIEEQKARDREELEKARAAAQGLKDEVIRSTDQQLKQAGEGGKSQMQNIQQKAKESDQGSTKSELDRIKQNSPQMPSLGK